MDGCLFSYCTAGNAVYWKEPLGAYGKMVKLRRFATSFDGSGGVLAYELRGRINFHGAIISLYIYLYSNRVVLDGGASLSTKLYL